MTDKLRLLALIQRLRCVPYELMGGTNGKYPLGELAHEAADALSVFLASAPRRAEMECRYSACVNHDLSKPRCDSCPNLAARND